MKTVIVIGCDFPPSNLPSALRMRFLVTHLEEFGWKPIVLTTDTKYSIHPIDDENSNLVPSHLEVVRTKALSLGITKNIRINDLGLRSLWHYWKELSNICSKREIDAILISVPPYIPMILGRLAKKKFGIPYFIDYQDPWVSKYFMKLPKAKRTQKAYMSYLLSIFLEPYSINKASGIISVSTKTIDEVLERYPKISMMRKSEIPLGIEPDDFEYLRNNPRENKFYNPESELINLSYIGVIYRGHGTST